MSNLKDAGSAMTRIALLAEMAGRWDYVSSSLPDDMDPDEVQADVTRLIEECPEDLLPGLLAITGFLIMQIQYSAATTIAVSELRPDLHGERAAEIIAEIWEREYAKASEEDSDEAE